MVLSAFPVAEDDVDCLKYQGGDVEMFMNAAIGDVECMVHYGCTTAHISNNLLDPWVLFRFINTVTAGISPSAASSVGDWRLFSAVGRMAKKLGCTDILPLIANTENHIAAFDQSHLTEFDKRGLIAGRDDLAKTLDRVYFQQYEKHFFPNPREESVSFEEFYAPVTALKTSLAEWISNEMPREILPTRQAAFEVWFKHNQMACDQDEDLYQAWACREIGPKAAMMLTELGKRLDRKVSPFGYGPRENRLYAQRFLDRDGATLIFIQFADAHMLMDADFCELARASSSPGYRRPSEPPMWSVSEEPQFMIDWKTNTVRPSGPIARRTKPITYSE